MQRTINKLREQPREHRVAIAAMIAIGVVVILLIGWFIFFMRGISKGQLEYTRLQTTETPSAALEQEGEVTPPQNVTATTSTSSVPAPSLIF